MIEMCTPDNGTILPKYLDITELALCEASDQLLPQAQFYQAHILNTSLIQHDCLVLPHCLTEDWERGKT